jgi:hypothetical protein
MTAHPTPASTPCPNGCNHQLTPDTTCPHCGHRLTIAEQRRLATRDRGRAALARTKAEWDRWKEQNPRGQRRTA